MPQKAPLNAPAPAKLCNCSVFGFFFPSGHVTMAASCRVISCFLLKSSITSSAFLHLQRFQTSELLKLLSFESPFMSKDFVGYCVSGQLANGGKTGTYAIVL